MKDEIARRHGNTEAVMALFLAKPRIWIPWADLAAVGGSCAWRTRVSDARKRFKKDGGTIEWNRARASAYRYLPQVPIGRDATIPIDQASLF